MTEVRVLHVIARMNVGGTARYVGDLVTSIPNSALAVGHVQGQEIEDPIIGSINTYVVPHLGRKISPMQDLKAYFELRELVRELKPKILHTHTFKAGLLGRLIGGEHKRVHTFHGHLFGDLAFSAMEKFFITRLERYLARRTDLLISVGKKVGEELRAEGVGGREHWISIPPGVNPLPRVDKAEARQILKVDENQLLVGWLARMTSVKNPLLLLELADLNPNLQFIMGGGGDLLDTVKMKAPNNVQVLGWTNPSIFLSALDCVIKGRGRCTYCTG